MILIKVLASTCDASSRPVQPPTSPASLYSSSHALLIGMAKYESMAHLPGVRDDLREIEKTLKGHGFSVDTIVDADRSKLLEKLDTFHAAHRDPDSRLLLYYAGHGYTSEHPYLGEQGFVLPIDADRDNAKAIQLGEFEGYAKRLEVKHVLFVFDACFAGTIFRSRSSDRPAPHLRDFTKHPERYFITAGDAGESVPDRSVFREFFVRALSGDADLNRDRFITATELGQYLHQNVTEASGGAQHPRHGEIRDPFLNEGEFVFETPELLSVPIESSRVKGPTQGNGQRDYKIGLDALLGRSGRHQGPRAYRSLRRAAESGHVRAQALLADIYYLGADGGGQDYHAAWETLQRPYEAGDPYARFLRAKMQYEALNAAGGAKAVETGAYHLRDLKPELDEAVGAEDPFAIYARAWIASQIDGDHATAVSLYRRAQALGHIPSLNNLAVHYEYGLGIRQDLDEAFTLHRRAVELGSITSLSNLGLAYEYGVGVDQDHGEALALYRRGAKLGNPTAMYDLGRAYAQGIGVVSDPELALTWYRRAATRGQREAMVRLGRLHLGGENLDFSEAYRWFFYAAERGHAGAMAQVGVLVRDGMGRPSDPARAVEWFESAALAGNPRGMVALAGMLFAGSGAPRDKKRAVELLRTAADLGDATAMLGLGDAHYQGLGVPLDRREAQRWYTSAAAKGLGAARERLTRYPKAAESPDAPVC